MKSSFTVRYRRINNPVTILLGVTSIVPNLNGILFYLENGQGHQVESYEMAVGDMQFLSGMCIEYSSDEEIAEYIEDAKDLERFEKLIVIDGRA